MNLRFLVGFAMVPRAPGATTRSANIATPTDLVTVHASSRNGNAPSAIRSCGTKTTPTSALIAGRNLIGLTNNL